MIELPRGVPPTEYSEEAWWRVIIEVLVLCRWDWWYHTHDSRGSDPGMPDVIAVRRADRRILFAELKAQRGVVSPMQFSVLELLLDVSGGGWRQALDARHLAGDERPHWIVDSGLCRIDVELWRPGDVDRVLEVLR